MSEGRRASERRRQRQREAQDLGEAAKEEGASAAPGEVTQFGAPILEDAPGGLPSAIQSNSGSALESTRVSERPAKPRPPGGALVDMSTGAKIVLGQTPFVLARHSLAAHVFDDPTLSREHAVLTYDRESGAWVIDDVGSKTGTAVNGEMLGAPGVLRHGDIIELGQTTLRYRWDPTIPEYVDPGVVAGFEGTAAGMTVLTRHTMAKGKKSAEGAPKKSKAGLVALLVVLSVLFVGVVGSVAGYFIWQAQQDPAAERAQIEQLLAEIKTLLGKLRLDDAEARIAAVYALDEDNKEAASLARLLKSEREAQAALKDAQAKFSALKYDDARDALARIPNSSGFAKQRDALLTQIRMEDAQGVLAEIKAMIDAGDLKAARKALERFLKANPNDTVATAMLERLVAIENRPKPKNRALERARGAFAVGNVKQARIVAQAEAGRGSADAVRYVGQVDSFTALYASGQAALRKKNGPAALGDLNKAYSMAKTLAGAKGSSYKKQVGAQLADALYLVAIIDRANARDCEWGKKIVRAAALDPGDSKIKAQKRKATAKAKGALERAQAKRSSAPAKAKALAQEGLCYASSSSKMGRQLKALAH